MTSYFHLSRILPVFQGSAQNANFFTKFYLVSRTGIDFSLLWIPSGNFPKAYNILYFLSTLIYGYLWICLILHLDYNMLLEGKDCTPFFLVSLVVIIRATSTQCVFWTKEWMNECRITSDHTSVLVNRTILSNLWFPRGRGVGMGFQKVE